MYSDPEAVRPFFADQSPVERDRAPNVDRARHARTPGSEGSGDTYGMRPLAGPVSRATGGGNGRPVL
jgi:hypothetical protein